MADNDLDVPMTGSNSLEIADERAVGGISIPAMDDFISYKIGANPKDEAEDQKQKGNRIKSMTENAREPAHAAILT